MLINDIIIWIWNHKQILLICVELVLSFIYMLLLVFSLKKKDNSKLNNILAVIPEFIKNAESVYGSGHGSDKLNLVMELIDKYNKLIKNNIDFDYLSYVEKILETPEKKGESP